jgi:predicted RNA-binding protein YlxR (DUF448 family)/ribosomal protein L7Ae-like RNA K-turn-binding protein
MRQRPQRTCIGCRGVFAKSDVVRIVAGPEKAVIDYRERLPGRAVYVCPRRSCIERALASGQLVRSLRSKISVPTVEEFVGALVCAIRDRVCSLLAVAGKAGKIAAGFSAVEDALGKGRVRLLAYASDISAGTRTRVLTAAGSPAPKQVTVELTTAEFGPIFGRELVGVIGIVDQGFAKALQNESERLKGLINTHA